MALYPPIGTVLLGKYRVDSLIGRGGMGAVVKAWQMDLDRPVAIKILMQEMLEREELVQRFLREAKAAVKLQGPHVARVLDVGRLPDTTPIIVMEYLEGADLGAIVKHHGAQDPRIAVDLLLQACEGLAEAHSVGIVHRDVKSSNFFISQKPNQPAVLKVLDFGIATAPQGTSELTTTQSVMGTPSYMAPEQMRSSKDVDARSDIWSLGVVLYELLEGLRPFRSDVYSELCLKVGMDPPIAMIRPGVPHELQMVVMKCLEKGLAQRYQSVADLAWDLVPFATDPGLSRGSAERCSRMLGVAPSPARVWDVPGRPSGAFAVPGMGMGMGPDHTPMTMPPVNMYSATPISSSHPSQPSQPSQPSHPSQVHARMARASAHPSHPSLPPHQSLVYSQDSRQLDSVPGVPFPPGPQLNGGPPTSVNMGSGQMGMAPVATSSGKKTGLVVGGVVAAIALGVGGFFAFGNRGGNRDVTPTSEPAAALPVQSALPAVVVDAAAVPAVSIDAPLANPIDAAPDARVVPDAPVAATVKPEPVPDVQPAIKPDVKPTIKPDVKPAIKPDVKPTIKPDVKPTVKPVKPVTPPTIKKPPPKPTGDDDMFSKRK